MKFKSEVQLEALNNATVDTDKFLVSDSTTVKYRTGAQVLSDIGGQAVLTNPITGTGTLNYVSKFTGTASLGNSQIFDNGSGVGIGTTSPNYTTSGRGVLDINGSSQSMLALSAGGVGKSFLFYTGTDLLISNESNGSIKFNTNGSEKAIITSTGNVGIGTTSPAFKLQLRSDSAASSSLDNTAFGLYNNSDGGSAIYFSNAVGAQSKVSFGVESTGVGTDDTYLGFSTGANTTISEKMRITSAGNVGIGTSSPYTKLQVNRSESGSNPGAVLRLENTGTNYTSKLILTDGVTNDANISYLGATQSLGFGIGGSLNQMVINSTGNVGIGTTSPSALLDVNGDALINGLTIGQGPVNNKQNTAIGRRALGAIVDGQYNIALGHGSNSDNDASGLTTIGVELNTDTNLSPLGRDCLAISQYNGNATSNQVPHIYAPEPISITSGISTDIITFDIDHYAGAIVEYLIRLNNGEDYAMGTVYMAWKSGGSGNYTDTREIEWNDMSGFVFDTNGGSTLSLDNTSGNDAWVRITVRGMMTN